MQTVSTRPTARKSSASAQPDVASLSAARRVRGASVLLAAAEKRAREPSLPADVRLRAIATARAHLSAAWQALTSLALEVGACEFTDRAAVYLGEVNRRLPILENTILVIEGGACSFCSDEGV